MAGPSPREFLNADAGIRADAENETKRADKLAAIPVPSGGFADVESVRDAHKARRPDDRAVKFLELHRSRVIRLPKAMREKAELAVLLAANVSEVEALKAAHAAATSGAQRRVEDHLIGQAFSGKLPNDWDWQVEWTGPTVSETQLEHALRATQRAKRRADQEFLASSRYADVRPMLEAAWAEIVEFEADPSEVSHLEFHKMQVRAEKASESLRSINESYTNDKKLRRAVHELSMERGGLANVEDVKLALNGKIKAAEVRVKPGDKEPVVKEPKIEKPIRRESEKEAAKRERAIEARRKARKENKELEVVATTASA